MRQRIFTRELRRKLLVTMPFVLLNAWLTLLLLDAAHATNILSHDHGRGAVLVAVLFVSRGEAAFLTHLWAGHTHAYDSNRPSKRP